jgi:hypothetical protein
MGSNPIGRKSRSTPAVAAYGWPADISEEDALARRLDVNRERAAAGR